MLPPTREDEARDRRRHRVFMVGVGAAFALTGAATLALAARMVAAGMGPGIVPVGGILLVGGGVMAWRGWTTDTAPDPSLPRWDELPRDDPRWAVPLATRRRHWAAGVAVGLAGWALAIGVVALGAALPGWARLAGFLGLSVGGVALGAAHARRHNGTDAFPDR